MGNMPKTISVNIIILNYNGKGLLEECLPSIIRAAKKTSCECKVTVIDNASSDDSVEFLENNFKEVRIDKRKDNEVLCAFNDFLKQSTEDISILLNNDIKVDENFIDPLIDVFNKNEDAFLAVPKMMSFDGARCENGKGRASVKYGMFWAISRYPGYEKDADEEALISHAANGAFRREKFVSLGGFDDLYLPGIMEDADLCFRAYKKGLRCYYQPKSIIYHKGRESFRKAFGEKKVDEIAHRNTFLFMWKNITSFRYMFEHILFLIPRFLFAIVMKKFEFVKGFLSALPLLPKALDRRKKMPYKEYIKKDAAIFKEIRGTKL